MKAVVKAKPQPGIDVAEVEDPGVKPDEVLIAVKAAGICGSDVHMYEWTPDYQAWLTPHLPLIPGHEYAGLIVKVGLAVKEVQVGDRVTATPYISCKRCHYCQTGIPQLCNWGEPPGKGPALALQHGFRRNGGMTTYVATPARNVFKLPDSIPFDEAGIIEAFCVGLHAVERARVVCGDTVAIFGPGPIGLSTLISVKASGSVNVAMIGLTVDKNRLELAKKIGADTVIYDQEDPIEKVMELTGGLGADVVFEATGNPFVASQAIEATRKGGETVLIGISPRPGEVDFNSIVRREINLKGSYGNTPLTWKRAIALLATRRIHITPLVTHKFALEDAVRAFETALKKKGVKVILKPNE